MCTVKVIDQKLKPNWCKFDDFLPNWQLIHDDKPQTLKADFSFSYFSITQRSNGHNFT